VLAHKSPKLMAKLKEQQHDMEDRENGAQPENAERAAAETAASLALVSFASIAADSIRQGGTITGTAFSLTGSETGGGEERKLAAPSPHAVRAEERNGESAPKSRAAVRSAEVFFSPSGSPPRSPSKTTPSPVHSRPNSPNGNSSASAGKLADQPPRSRSSSPPAPKQLNTPEAASAPALSAVQLIAN